MLLRIITGDYDFQEDFHKYKSLSNHSKVIEQQEYPSKRLIRNFPEVYKHPKSFCKEIEKYILENINNVPIDILTFSESLINLTGDLVYKGNLKAEETSVLIFIKDEDRPRLCYYTDEGLLEKGWPLGFFCRK